MIGYDEDADDPPTGFGGNDVDGILSADAVAAEVIEGVRAGRFLIVPHTSALTHFRRKADDYDRWIGGMRKFRRRLIESGEFEDEIQALRPVRSSKKRSSP